MFNMHKLFPERFPEGDELWVENCELDWMIENTGSKWVPGLEIDEFGNDTRLIYDTARVPNKWTLERLHRLTGWTITNEYEEPNMLVEWTFTCENGECWDDEREYQTSCEICEQKKPRSEYDEEQDGLICNDCRKKQLSSKI